MQNLNIPSVITFEAQKDSLFSAIFSIHNPTASHFALQLKLDKDSLFPPLKNIINPGQTVPMQISINLQLGSNKPSQLVFQYATVANSISQSEISNQIKKSSKILQKRVGVVFASPTQTPARSKAVLSQIQQKPSERYFDGITDSMINHNPDQLLKKLIEQKQFRIHQLQQDKKYFQQKLRGVPKTVSKGSKGKSLVLAVVGLLLGALLGMYLL